MNRYELMAILRAQLPPEEKDGIYKQIMDAVQKSGGKVINSQVWLEKHRPTFSVKKVTDVTYHLTKFECVALALEKIRQTVRLNENILRFLIVKAE